MTSSSLRLLAAVGTAFALTIAAVAQELPIIAKARARLGPESALNAVTSIHYVGTLVTTDPSDPAKQERAAIDIIFQKLAKGGNVKIMQRISATSSKLVETTALDDYEAWQRKQDAADATKWQQTLLGGDQIKRLRANTWETLAFFRGLDSRGGRIEDKGAATIEGVACQKVAFVYAPNIVFTRYFDLATGRLVFTETESGNTLREQGEILEGGLRFPKSLVTTTKNNKGQTQTVTINVEKVTVNETFPAALFVVPGLSTKK